MARAKSKRQKEVDESDELSRLTVTKKGTFRSVKLMNHQEALGDVVGMHIRISNDSKMQISPLCDNLAFALLHEEDAVITLRKATYVSESYFIFHLYILREEGMHRTRATSDRIHQSCSWRTNSASKGRRRISNQIVPFYLFFFKFCLFCFAKKFRSRLFTLFRN